jgi:hypothetical protein
MILDYLRERSAQLDHELPGDCVDEACAVAAALIEDGEKPWIGRLRDWRGNFHGPLHPSRFSGRNAPAYTTHYVACAGDRVFDPIAGEPLPVADYAQRVFGRQLPIERVVDADEVSSASRIDLARLIRSRSR